VCGFKGFYLPEATACSGCGAPRPPLKLWVVQVETTMAVMARTHQEAEEEAERSIRQEDPAAFSCLAKVATRLTDFDSDLLDTYPWGGDDKMTVAKLLESKKEL
jgi:hypothetical protein